MTISKDLMLSILSMDAYNHGYDQGTVVGQSQIGNATITYQSSILPESAEVAASFYALSYTLGSGVEGVSSGTTVISYRGTDSLWGDFSTDLQTLLGTADTEQLQLPAALYQQVDLVNGINAIITTGHSLGGALAGLIGAITGSRRACRITQRLGGMVREIMHPRAVLISG